jgi:hypothetical protein
MTSMPATETPTSATPLAPLENWAGNEPMRHIPQVAWMAWKVDYDLRRRIGILMVPYTSLAHEDQRRGVIENNLRALCRAIDRLTECARPARNAHPPQELTERIAWALNQAAAALNSLDPQLIGRRSPYHTGERSKAEPLYGALLTVIQQVEKLLVLIREVDRNVDERLLEGLVTLEAPLRTQPIA